MRNRLGYRLTCLAAVLSFALAASACGGTSSQSSAKNQTLVIGVTALPVSMDLEKTTGCQESEPMINVWEELYTPTTIQENGYTRANWGKGTASFAPRAARKINVSSNGLTWTVQIRPGVRAPSGDEFTTADIMWWLRRKAHFNGTGAFGDGIVGWNPKNVKVLSKYQIQFTTPKPNPLALEGLANIFDNAVDSKVYIKHATPSDPWAANWANTHAAGYGPYQLVSFQPGDQAVFTANPNYWAGPPAIKKVILKEIPSSATQLELLQAGSINLTRGLTVQQFATAAKNPNLKVIRVPGTYEAMAQINTAKGGPLGNPQVRRALQLLTPQQQIIKTAYAGNAARPWSGPLLDIYAGYKSGYWSYDPAKARALLAAAGYGKGFTVHIMTSNEFPQLESTAIILKNSWAQAKINAVIDVLPRGAYTEKETSGHFDISLNESQAFLIDTQYYLNLWFKTGSFYNYGHFSDPQLDSLISETASTLDQPHRVKLFQQASDVLAQKMPWVWLAQVNSQYAMSKNLQGFVYYPSTCVLWRNFHWAG